jgi:exopolysaccharide biosynthesis protein
MHVKLEQMPPDARCAVSGNALVVAAGRVIQKPPDGVRHPRTAVGISKDGDTLLLVAVDGRQEGHSRGATLAELGELMKGFGAHDALNLDGGGSTAMIVKDRATGVFAVVNRPSDPALKIPEQRIERPVVDVLGVRLREAGSAPMRH